MASPPASDRPGSESNSPPSALRLSESASEGLSLARASEHLIQQFGGIRPMANKLEVPVTTVQGWKKRGAIPATRLNDLRAAAVRHGIRLEEAELEAVGRSEERNPDTARTRTVSGPAASEVETVPPPSEPPPGDGPPPAPPMPPMPPVPPAEEPAVPFEAPVAAPAPIPAPPPAPIPSPPPFGPAGLASPARPPADAIPSIPSIRPRPMAQAAGRKPVASGAARVALAAAAVALVAAAVAVFGASSSNPLSSSSAFSSVTEHRLGDLEGKVSRVTLEQSAQTSAIEKQIGALDARLALSASQQTTSDLARRLAALEQDLPALQQRVAAQGVGTPALAELLSANPLRARLATAEPFSEELTAFRLTGFNDPPLKLALDQISSHAHSGIPSQAWLIGRFSVVAGNIVRAANWENPVQQAADLFLDLLSDWTPPLYRLTGVSEGQTPRAMADRAQALMSAGDFSRAVDQVGELTGKPAEAAVAWLAEARARVIADRARELITKHMLFLSQSGAASP
jgi:hypothetical protein